MGSIRLDSRISRDIAMSGVRATTYAEVLEKALEAELCESRIQKDNTARWEARKASNGGGDNKRKLPSNQHNEADKRNKIGSNNYKGKKPYVDHDKDKVYLKGKDKIVPPFRFGVEDVATKMWFHKLAYPGQCLTNSHLDIIFYYLRKKGKYAKEPKVKFTTTDCLFFKTIHALYEKFVAQKKDLSLITAQHAIADYIRGGKMLCGSPWHLCDHVLFIIHMETESHWILGRLNIEERRMYMYNSLSIAMKDSAAIKACQPFAVLLPHFFALFDEFKKENKPVCLDPFEVVKVDGLPQQTSNDCGCFVASFAEYFIDMKPIPPIFDVEKHRDRLAVLFYKYAHMKEVDFIDSEDEAPPKDYVHNHRQFNS
ncbi:hypothetical protein G4B88_001994 [Cannabis sativa]|uniref:Ubiquitin-like protease family profile domain-containing protein n=2 Tax=Cannabis sativa TaxID=3483 RepID=A0A7J6HFQ5_CANSA|nr:hypothetical protein G4B88_001994 [Cannabis sativa]